VERSSLAPGADNERPDMRLPRSVHPVAWWIWALGLATAASFTTNPLLLALVLVVAGITTTARRSDAPWARAFRAYLILGLIVVAMRVVFRIVFGGTTGGEDALFRLPQIPLPSFMAGVTLGGPVSTGSILGALYDGVRLATILCCVGAANTLANPKRALRSLPSALYEIGVTITVAIVIAPQLVESGQRVRRARKLRGATEKGRRAVRGVAMPVLHDALDRSFQLAAAMDARGYGRNTATSTGARRITGVLMLLGLAGLCVGGYAVLDPTTPRYLGVPMLVFATVSATVGFVIGGRRVHRTKYRPDPWLFPEWCTALSGVVAAAAMIATSHVNLAALNPSVSPPAWPQLPILPVIGLAIALLPAFVTPTPPVTKTAPTGTPTIDRAGAERERVPA
jgi:energy-coupling factor transport system permease protein